MSLPVGVIKIICGLPRQATFFVSRCLPFLPLFVSFGLPFSPAFCHIELPLLLLFVTSSLPLLPLFFTKSLSPAFCVLSEDF